MNIPECKSAVQYIRDNGLKKEPCASCNERDEETRCYFNDRFTNCPWTGRALEWARKLEGTYITVEISNSNKL